MAIHESKIIWHDLIEDPNDLPTKYNQQPLGVLWFDIEQKEIYPDYDCAFFGYDEKHNCWAFNDLDVDFVYYRKSYGQIPVPGVLSYDDPGIVVIAWCEYPEEYTPDIFKIKEETENA